MVESSVGGLPGGVLYKDPEDVLEAFVKGLIANLGFQVAEGPRGAPHYHCV